MNTILVFISINVLTILKTHWYLLVELTFSTGKLLITQHDKLTISRVLFDLTIGSLRLPIETGRWQMCRLMKENINYVLKIN